ncbi:hypothetical protein F183_A10590 [Bryobacterales bacterium F-183]|nr:hypothetical protein F183_A10590 [Bryobacterales bacterium F-183]
MESCSIQHFKLAWTNEEEVWHKPQQGLLVRWISDVLYPAVQPISKEGLKSSGWLVFIKELSLQL